MAGFNVVLTSDHMTATELVAHLESIGVSASILVLEDPIFSETWEGVSPNHEELADVVTSGKHGLPQALHGLVWAAAAGALTKSPVYLLDTYYPSIAYCILGWAGSFLISTGEERNSYLHYLWAARQATAN